jgi:hypothetical protein
MTLVVADPFLSEEEQERFFHRDVEDLAPRDLWAEMVTVENALAVKVFSRRRPKVVGLAPHLMTEIEWLQARRAVLKRELARRRKAAPVA